MRVDGAVALVTGASSGIGRRLATRLVDSGARVFAHGRDPAALAEVPGATPIAMDLADPSAPRALARRVLDLAGRVDLLVNNAGAGWAGPFADLPPEDLDRLLAVNLRAPAHLTRAVLPGMLDRGRGRLLFVGSIAGRLGVREEAVYAAAKAGLDVFAESLRLELAGTGVGVTVVVPGVVDTPFFERRGLPYRRRRPRPLPVERVAEAVLDAVEADRPEVYLPAWLRLPVAVRALAPGGYRRLTRRFG
ncbi:SDR family NAD(P)-dependent oxidoreductase [Rhizomonospora bruguierae]|uniref:SDR family NAD(P)-dependent oxidoreductase n=1 Tax=Rhizomonospora bruguierae TaxID=1581705 RepID=UPI001BCFFEA7|nr:SDR family oxidoreductase [Micromonospora sp. NBRC 107566]